MPAFYRNTEKAEQKIVFLKTGGLICSRLAAGRAFCKGIVCTPARRGMRKFVVTFGGVGFIGNLVCTARRRGVPFTRVRRRGLCSMSGRYPYGIGNPPTLRRSSFPQRALCPAGGPIPKHAWGCAPRPPNAKLRLDTNDVNIVRTAPQIRSQGASGAFYFGPSRNQIKNQPCKRRLAPDPGSRPLAFRSGRTDASGF